MTEEYERGKKAGEESGRLHALEEVTRNHHQRLSNLERIAWITFGAIGIIGIFPAIKAVLI